MINFTKYGLNYQKPQNMKSAENTQWICMKNAWKHEIKYKRKGIKDLPALGDKNLAKISEENDKKSLVEPSQVGEREREWKVWKVLKKRLWKSPIWLLKNMIHEFRSIKKEPRSIKTDRDFNKTILKKFDWSKISFDQSKQTEAL